MVVTAQKDSALFGGLLGWARAVEVAWGERNGWHAHIHVLLCFAEQVSADLVVAGVGARMFGRWRRALERRSYAAVRLRRHAQLVIAAIPRSADTGPADDGRTSKSKIAVGR
ncbi:hypothetical protein [Actinomycetospora sp. CA-053990]|uniref:hypothetical protein n=1 Tax=Actinomycetospora sp. CA-053990 TaxID=3239891 RepID=UPI003D8B1BCB